MKSLYFILVTNTVLLNGCASIVRVDPMATAEQTTVFKNGTEAIVSKKRYVVAIRSSVNMYTSDNFPAFVVSFHNISDKPVTFSTENISAFIAGTGLRVFSYEELVAEVESKRKWAVFSAALSGAAQSMSAAQEGNQFTQGTYNTSYYGSRGYAGSGYGTYSGYTYNPAAAARAQATVNAETRSNLENINASANSTISDLSRMILRKETVLPNEWHGGYIRIEQGPTPELSNTLSFRVLIDDEEHKLDFIQTKVK